MPAEWFNSVVLFKSSLDISGARQEVGTSGEGFWKVGWFISRQ